MTGLAAAAVAGVTHPPGPVTLPAPAPLPGHLTAAPHGYPPAQVCEVDLPGLPRPLIVPAWLVARIHEEAEAGTDTLAVWLVAEDRIRCTWQVIP